ncbi:MAG TPA: hypothetical protein DCL21_04740 [Alphaproteobacteria bacterium]|nr:hypothetical protein [Alphaproteobacteria bacterium]
MSLFNLKASRHPELVSGSQENSLKKGAMFGLDARIALVIFGLVGLITSASLIHTIKETKSGLIIYELSQIKKAVEVYEIDTDSELPFVSASIFNIGELVNSSVKGWKGPYLEYKQQAGVDSNRYFLTEDAGRFSIFQAKDRAAAAVSDTPYVACDASSACYIWVLFEPVSGVKLSTAYQDLLDKEYDDKDGFLTGKVQQYNANLLFRLGLREYY